MRYTFLLMLALSILGLLMSGPQHGYEIRKQLGELLGKSGAISYGSLYPTLAKLQGQGLIYSEIENEFSPKPKSPSQVFSTGSLVGDMAYSSKSPFNKTSTLLANRKRKKVYTLTEKGEAAFKEKLLNSYVKHADDDRAFVAHLAFIDFANDEERNIFFNHRNKALQNKLETIPSSDNHALKLWLDVEREYIENQISFLNAMREDLKI